MPREGVDMCTTIVCCYRQLYYCLMYPMYYAQCYKKLHSNGLMHCTIVLLVLKGIALHKGPGL